MRDPFNASVDLIMDRQSPFQRVQPDSITAGGNYSLGNGSLGSLALNSTFVRHENNRDPVLNNLIADDVNSRVLDPEVKELYLRSRSQEEEIVQLRKQIADACSKELQLLNEKHILERKLTDLRMALDEKQNDAISGTLKELSQKKGHLEENMRLASDLKVAEEDVFFLTSSILGLLAEYNVRPSQLSATAITGDIKRLHQQMQWKIRSLHDNLGETSQSANVGEDHLMTSYMDPKLVSYPQYSQYPVNGHTDRERLVQDFDMLEAKDAGNINGATRYFDDAASGAEMRSDGNLNYYMPPMHDNQEYVMDGDHPLPGIEGFQIIGEPIPGNTLRACGYPTNGTSLCNFQWVRYLDNGTMQSIDGATVPDYVVTADDVGSVLAVDCTPMDDSGRSGELVREFANNQCRIACDIEMQGDLDTYMSSGKATFDTLVLVTKPDGWEQATLLLWRQGYQIKVKNSEAVIIEEKYSADLFVKVPNGLSTQFVLISSGGKDFIFNTSGMSQPSSGENDIRLRDTIVLALRYFQIKALDSKRKAKV